MGRLLHRVGEALLGMERIAEGQGDQTRRYYVYVVYIMHNGREVWLYAGKGTGDRKEQHKKLLERKLKLNRKLDAHERLMLLAQDLGFTIYDRTLYTNLTEDEAYNLENKTINENSMMQRGNVAYPHRIVYTRRRK